MVGKAKSTVTEEQARLAWRGMLIPAVGSAAFFASMLTNIFKTHERYGFPKNAFRHSDYILMAIPFIIVPLALLDGLNGEHKEDGA
tara:strand:+ start:705 stop:962 length:258 start_codon:yes stop_codon:yes gene_type:complete